MPGHERHRLGYIGAGWITPFHLEALDRLERTNLVAVAAPRQERAAALAAPRGAAAYVDVARMLDEQAPDVVYVAVPPSAAIAVCEQLVERGIPFLVEKPLSAMDPDGSAAVAAAITAKRLVVAVGYHLRALEPLPEVRERLLTNPSHLVVARWLSGTPAPAWWLREVAGGGQVVEQATHFYDLARHLVGEASVVAAVSTREEPVVPEGADVADATAAVLRFESGAVGSFANSRRLANVVVEIEFMSAGLLTTIRRTSDPHPGSWEVSFAHGHSVVTYPPGRDPYERQAEAFLDAVEAGDPDAVLATYSDAARTDALTREVVAATGKHG